MGVLWGENIVQESSRLPRFSLRLNPEPEVSPPWHSRPEDDRGDGAEAPPHGEGSLSRLPPRKLQRLLDVKDERTLQETEYR